MCEVLISHVYEYELKVILNTSSDDYDILLKAAWLAVSIIEAMYLVHI